MVRRGSQSDEEEYEENCEWEEGEEEEGDEEQDGGFWSPALWMRKQQQPENISPEIAALDLDGMKQTRRALFLEKQGIIFLIINVTVVNGRSRASLDNSCRSG